MENKYLYETIEALDDAGLLVEIPDVIKTGLSPNIVLRDYQEKSFKYFITYFENENLKKNKQVHTLFHMATGSGKTVIMAGLILYLYTKGYRKFLFFVNQSNIVEKTKENFTNSSSNKFLFTNELSYSGNKIKIKMVDSFSTNIIQEDIEICFTTTQKLHMDLSFSKENTITYKDFEENKIVFISDESHHVNSMTKKITKSEEEEINSWEYSVTRALASNRDSLMIEFTATADLKDRSVMNKYKDKIIFDYPLKKFRESGYTKDFQNFATESDLWNRTLMALIISEYRKYLFSDMKINIKPVIMLKSQKIAESKEFYDVFFENIKKLKKEDIVNLHSSNIELFIKALDYFESKDESFELLVQSIKNSFTKDTSVIMNESTDNNKEKQILVNSLEDEQNHIRTIFTVDMLNEGWDVLNLYDIVRLYDTRQGSGSAGKIGNYTMKEAQLIGRGARYCPFKISDEQEKYKRKYDFDLNNDYRILETMLFHSRNDSRYISELKQALIATGLQPEEPIKLDYFLKEKFLETNFYNKSYVYSNKRILKDRKNVIDIEDSLKTKVYRYLVNTNRGAIIDLISDYNGSANTNLNMKSFKFKNIDYNILQGSVERYNELKFEIIKNKYPNVKTMREFLTSENYLGNSIIEISYFDKITGKNIRSACIKAFDQIAKHILSIKQEYAGTQEFEPKQLKSILKNKSIYLSKIDKSGGRGDSQNNCSNDDYRLDLSKEEWYVFNDNYGTSEEKLFIKFFKNQIIPTLLEKELEFYVIRNERVPDLAIYSFEHGERFEPDYLLFIKKKEIDKFVINQIYAEPKGSNLLEEDKWKETFMLEMQEKAFVNSLIKDGNDYKVIGLPFYNEEYKKTEFEESILAFLSAI